MGPCQTPVLITGSDEEAHEKIVFRYLLKSTVIRFFRKQYVSASIICHFDTLYERHEACQLISLFQATGKCRTKRIVHIGQFHYILKRLIQNILYFYVLLTLFLSR